MMIKRQANISIPLEIETDEKEDKIWELLGYLGQSFVEIIRGSTLVLRDSLTIELEEFKSLSEEIKKTTKKKEEVIPWDTLESFIIKTVARALKDEKLLVHPKTAKK